MTVYVQVPHVTASFRMTPSAPTVTVTISILVDVRRRSGQRPDRTAGRPAARSSHDVSDAGATYRLAVLPARWDTRIMNDCSFDRLAARPSG
jgi:hypothetical protein